MKLPRSPQIVRYGNRTPIGAVLRHGIWRNSAGPNDGRRLAHFCFVYTLAGKTTYEDRRVGRHSLVPGDLLLVYPQIAHRYGNGMDGGWDEAYVVFDGPVFDLWKKGLLDPQKPIVHLEPVSYWQKRLLSCGDGVEMPGLAYQMKQVLSLLGFMTEVFETQANHNPEHANYWLNQACQRLESNLEEEIDWNAFSRSLGLSSEKFRKAFTQAMGVSPGRYRTAKIIDRACEMISREHKLGKEIAGELGFANEQHFSRRFRQVTGLTLTQFRRQTTRFPQQ